MAISKYVSFNKQNRSTSKFRVSLFLFKIVLYIVSQFINKIFNRSKS